MSRLAGKISDGIVMNMADGDVLGEIITAFCGGVGHELQGSVR